MFLFSCSCFNKMNTCAIYFTFVSIIIRFRFKFVVRLFQSWLDKLLSRDWPQIIIAYNVSAPLEQIKSFVFSTIVKILSWVSNVAFSAQKIFFPAMRWYVRYLR